MYHVFSSIAIEPTVSVALRRGFKKPVQSSLISVTPGTRTLKCDYISLYLHNWAAIRLCIVFSIGESPRVCSKYSHWYYLLLTWGGAKVSSIAIELLLQGQKRKSCRFFFFAHGGQPLLIRLFSDLKLLPIVFQSDQDDCWMIMHDSVQWDTVCVMDLNIASSEYRTDDIDLGRANRSAAWTTSSFKFLCRAW